MPVSTHPGSPLEPQFEDVVMSAALDHLVAGVVADVVALVGLEEIVGRHLVTADEQSLEIDLFKRNTQDLQSKPLNSPSL